MITAEKMQEGIVNFQNNIMGDRAIFEIVAFIIGTAINKECFKGIKLADNDNP